MSIPVKKRIKISDYLEKSEVQKLVEPSTLRGFQAVATSWVMIAGCFAAVGFYPSVWTILPALVLIGGRQLALAILMHDCAHYSLFNNRNLNQWIGKWLCAYPVGHDLDRYREHHLRHHQYGGSEKDPDLDLVTGYPTTPSSMKRKVFRDLIGLTGLKRLYGVFLMDFGYIRYTVSATTIPLDQTGRKPLDILRTGLKNSYGKIITNLALILILAAFGKPYLYALWIIAYLTTFSLIIRIRSIAEHACTQLSLNPIESTRTTYANPLARVTVAPHRVNYHLEHHLLANVPYFNLPVLHEILKRKGALEDAYVAKNYGEVLKIATSREAY